MYKNDEVVNCGIISMRETISSLPGGPEELPKCAGRDKLCCALQTFHVTWRFTMRLVYAAMLARRTQMYEYVFDRLASFIHAQFVNMLP